MTGLETACNWNICIVIIFLDITEVQFLSLVVTCGNCLEFVDTKNIVLMV